jgi:hypothetical protein
LIRVLITGDRGWYCLELARRVLGRLGDRWGVDNLIIVHGCAAGVDTAFDHAAKMARLKIDPNPADWDRYQRAAGPIRNREMVEAGASFCVAVHRDLATSKGTKDCVSQCLKAQIPVYLIDSEHAKPRRLHSIPGGRDTSDGRLPFSSETSSATPPS